MPSVVQHEGLRSRSFGQHKKMLSPLGADCLAIADNLICVLRRLLRIEACNLEGPLALSGPGHRIALSAQTEDKFLTPGGVVVDFYL